MVVRFGANFALVEAGLGLWCGGRVCSWHFEGDAWEGESGSQFEERGREKMLFLHLFVLSMSRSTPALKKGEKFLSILHRAAPWNSARLFPRKVGCISS